MIELFKLNGYRDRLKQDAMDSNEEGIREMTCL